MQIAQIQLRIHYCTPCSDAISGPKNRVCEIKSGHDFCRYRNSIQVIYFQINEPHAWLTYMIRFCCAVIYSWNYCTRQRSSYEMGYRQWFDANIRWIMSKQGLSITNYTIAVIKRLKLCLLKLKLWSRLIEINIQDVKDMILTDIVAKGKEAKLASFEQVWLQCVGFYFHCVTSVSVGRGERGGNIYTQFNQYFSMKLLDDDWLMLKCSHICLPLQVMLQRTWW